MSTITGKKINNVLTESRDKLEVAMRAASAATDVVTMKLERAQSQQAENYAKLAALFSNTIVTGKKEVNGLEQISRKIQDLNTKRSEKREEIIELIKKAKITRKSLEKKAQEADEKLQEAKNEAKRKREQTDTYLQTSEEGKTKLAAFQNAQLLAEETVRRNASAVEECTKRKNEFETCLAATFVKLATGKTLFEVSTDKTSLAKIKQSTLTNAIAQLVRLDENLARLRTIFKVENASSNEVDIANAVREGAKQSAKEFRDTAAQTLGLAEALITLNARDKEAKNFQKAIATISEDIAEGEVSLNQIENSLKPGFTETQALLRQQLQNKTLIELQETARNHPGQEDDKLVNCIESTNTIIEELFIKKKETIEAYKIAKKNYEDTEDIARKFSNNYRNKSFNVPSGAARGMFDPTTLASIIMLNELNKASFFNSLDSQKVREQTSSYGSSSSSSWDFGSSSSSSSSSSSGGFGGGGGFGSSGSFGGGGGFGTSDSF